MSHQDRVSPALRFRVLSELMKVAASSLDLAETFDQLGEQIKRLIDYDILSFGFLRPGDEHLEIYAITGSNLEGQVHAPLHSSSIGDAVLTGLPQLLNPEIHDSPGHVDISHHPLSRGLESGSRRQLFLRACSRLHHRWLQRRRCSRRIFAPRRQSPIRQSRHSPCTRTCQPRRT